MPAMDQDKNVMAEKIIKDIAAVFWKDSLLKEFDIIPIATNDSNKNPVVHISHRLGLESWCVKYVYSYAYNTLMEKYFAKCTHKLPKVTQNNFEDVNKLLLGALLINPDVIFFWNKRREMYLKEFTTFSEEMKFTRIVLTRKPKNNESFSYRRWLFEELFSRKYFVRPSQNQMSDLVQEEQSLTKSCADKNPNNYHAWSHRIWFMNWLLKISTDSSYKTIYCQELSFSECWISTHISDYSGLHYRQLILYAVMEYCQDMLETQERLVNSVSSFVTKNCSISDMCGLDIEMNSNFDIEKNIMSDVTLKNGDHYRVTLTNLKVMLYELNLNEELSNLYPCHEALWSHRRFILKFLIKLISQITFNQLPRTVSAASSLDSNYLRTGLSGNITSIPNISSKDVLDETDSLGKEPKILKFDDHSIENGLLYKAVIGNEKKWIKQRAERNDPFAYKYQNWLRMALNMPV